LKTRFDPFADRPDPALYVPREASEHALDALLACVGLPDRPAALLAPPGLGKTLLLHLLAGRLPAGLHGVYVPNPALAPADLCAWTLGCLGTGDWPDPVPVLAAYVEHCGRQGGALVWLVDDAHDLPEETARWIGHLLPRWGGALRLVVAAIEDERAKTLDALGPLHAVRALARPMSAGETRAYARARLGLAPVDATLRQRLEAALEGIHRASGGIPREVSAAASDLLAGRVRAS
jgi:type II secretory pathway predicted ATPase ExeA